MNSRGDCLKVVDRFRSCNYTPTTLGSQYRVRVTSTDGTASASDASDANFTVWGMEPTTASHSNVITLEDSVQVTITWHSSVATQTGADVVKFYDAASGGNVINPCWASYSTENDGLTHTAICKITPCVPQFYWYYEGWSVLSGATVKTVRNTATRFKVQVCIEP
jgi:hypothetical protein